MCLKCEQFVTQFGKNAVSTPEKSRKSQLANGFAGFLKVYPRVPFYYVILYYEGRFEGHLGRRPKSGVKGDKANGESFPTGW